MVEEWGTYISASGASSLQQIESRLLPQTKIWDAAEAGEYRTQLSCAEGDRGGAVESAGKVLFTLSWAGDEEKDGKVKCALNKANAPCKGTD
ncbi:MAG TPA: hypothetical protein VFE24_01885 [Pirellulales bacterium]|nr:hypothetical protein [Pirellulales bacterium]